MSPNSLEMEGDTMAATFSPELRIALVSSFESRKKMALGEQAK